MDNQLIEIGQAADAGRMHGIGRALAPLLAAGDAVVLTGDLGAGKTQLAQGVAEGLGVGAAAVSPTFNIVLAYDDGRLPLYHLDLYRLEDESELEGIDFYRMVGPDSDGVALVEWGERFPGKLPADRLEAHLTIGEGGVRTVAVRPTGARSATLMEGWAQAVAASAAGSSDVGRMVGEACAVGEAAGAMAGGTSAQEACALSDEMAARRACVLTGEEASAAVPALAASEGIGAEGEPAAAAESYVLAFDTANEVIAIGLGELDAAARQVRPVAVRQVQAHRASNTQLLPCIDEVLASAGVARGQLACMAVGLGPGSFTGVRIACATAKGAASALGVGLVGLPTLDAVAWGAWADGARGELLVVADAMRKEVYPARFQLDGEGARRLGPDRVGKAEAVAQEFAGSEGLSVAGDGLAKHAELFAGCGAFLPEGIWAPTGRGLLLALQAAWRAGEVDPFDPKRHAPGAVLPVYTRLSDAEENERQRLASTDPRNLRTGVQDVPAPDGGIGRATLHSAAQLGAQADAAGIAYSPLDSAHAGAVAALEAQVMGTDAWSAAMVADELPRGDRRWWMALHDGELVGYAGGMVVDGELQVLKVGTAPAWRRQGIARQLIERLMDDGRNLGAARVSLEVRASNEGAQAFYEVLGLRSEGVRPRYYSDREDAVIMAGPMSPVAAGAQVSGRAQVGGMAIEHHADTATHGQSALEHPLILAVESSCDETAAALVDGTGTLLADVVASQVDFHSRFGGVVPEIASRKHIEAICGVCDECFDEAARSLGVAPGGLGWDDVQAVAATYAPGLVGALVVGVAFAKGAAWALDVPYVEVNHLEGHLYANRLGDAAFEPPAVVSLVSGGNTMLVHMAAYGDYRILGATIDDAVGEAFDKVAKALGLGYPGGPAISRLAAEGDPTAIDFPRAMLHSGDLRFSLSGLKTAVMNYLSKQRQAGADLSLPDVCASFQQAVIDVQVAKARTALRETGAPTLCVGGGVAANPALRQAYEALCRQLGVRLVMPPLHSCGDNAGMIALVALDRFREGKVAPLSADAFAHRSLEEPY